MRILIALIIIPAFFSCRSVKSQNKELDATFNEGFIVLDSVVKGYKNQKQLTHEQTSFLYIINDWSNNTADFNHYEGVRFDKNHLKAYKLWYSRHSSQIDPDDFRKAMDIQVRFFKAGLLPDVELEYLTKLSDKYRKLK